MVPVRVCFQACDHEWDVEVSMCGERDCDCENIWVELRQVPEHMMEKEFPEHFIEVDTATWTEVDPPPRSAEESAMVAEFLRDYPESERQLYRERVVAKIAAQRRLKSYRIPPEDVRRGKLIDFGQIVSEKGGYPTGDLSFAFGLHYGGSVYRVVDSYCPNPNCDCREAHLLFLELAREVGPNGIGVLLRQFSARISLAGQVTLGSDVGNGGEEARTLCKVFMDQPGFMGELSGRYAAVRAIGKHSLVPMPDSRETPVPSWKDGTGRIGRNDPCVCGSGRKYKKCCGA